MENGHSVKYSYALPVAFALFVISMMALAGTTTFYFLIPDNDGTLLRTYESPRTILNQRPGVDHPIVAEQGTLTVRGFRCIVGDNPVTVQQYISIMGEKGSFRVEGYGDAVSRSPGCITETMLVPLPKEVVPGFYHLEAIERSSKTGEIRLWYSEDFEVVPR